MALDSISQRYLTDENLISNGLQGNQDAFNDLFSRHRRLLYSLANRILHNHEEAEDAVQNCLLSAFRSLPSFKSQSAFRSWLVRILINEALASLRRKRSRPAIAFEQPSSEEQGEWIERFPAPGPNPEQAFAAKESVDVLRRQVRCLPAPLHSPILLCDIKEKTFEEAGTILRLAPNTVKARLFRGRRKLEAAMRASRMATPHGGTARAPGTQTVGSPLPPSKYEGTSPLTWIIVSSIPENQPQTPGGTLKASVPGIRRMSA